MLILDRHNRSEKLLSVLETAKKDIESWHMANIKIMHGSKSKIDAATSKLAEVFGEKDGVMFKVEDHKILFIARFGRVDNHAKLKREIEASVHALGCRVTTMRLTDSLLSSLEVDYVLRDGHTEETLFLERTKRIKNHFLIIDDDNFVGASTQSLLENYGRSLFIEDVENIEDRYLEFNPDFVLLDINMPGDSGLNVINRLMEIDPDVFIVMLSSESHQKNILTALSSGAVGFLAKPVCEQALSGYIKQCTTLLNIY